MVADFDYCLHGRGGAAPSIDTAMHGLVDAAHVDHLHPDAGIALATAADGEALTRACFGDRVGWVPWRRPGFQLGLDIAEATAPIPVRSASSSAVTASPHGATRATSARPIAGDHPQLPRHSSTRTARPNRSARPGRDSVPLPQAERHRRLRDRTCLRGLASTDYRQVGHFNDAAEVLDFLAGAKCARLGRAWHVVPRPFPAHEGSPDAARPAARRAADEDLALGCASCTRPTGRTTRRYYERHASADSPAMRGADPAIVLVPGVGMFSFGANAQTARVAGEFYVNAINVMRGAEAVSTYAPIDEAEKFRIEYWQLEEAKLQRHAQAQAARHPSRPRHRSRLRHRPGHRPSAGGRRRLRRRRRPRRVAAAIVAEESAVATRRSRCAIAMSPVRTRSRRHSARPHSRSVASTSWSTTPACPSPNRCSRPRSKTGTCSTTSWPRAPSWSHGRPRK